MLSPSLLSIPSTMFVTAHDLCPIEERQFGRFFKNSIRAVRSAPLFSIIPTYPRLALHSSTQRLRAFRILSKPERYPKEMLCWVRRNERWITNSPPSLPIPKYSYESNAESNLAHPVVGPVPRSYPFLFAVTITGGLPFTAIGDTFQ